ncbi:nuclear transport factor 2 family protein [Burkholderia cepacia]|uniref:nuclear transport factor 2 family protein n=2 Tax=Burkholderia cepacia complex TaxID=87882 RepID=UPI001CF4263F|nr:nuclear transport factor 2 family protein [Burkholderia cepacia]MCA8081973.1 nuclear transport factor 2 family protein [Burkholderia cepacia]
MQLPKTAKNRNLETVRIRVLPPVLLAPLRRPSPAPLRRPATVGREAFRAFLQRMDRCYGEQLRGIVVMVSADGLCAGAEYVVHGEYKVTDDGLPEAQGQRYVLPGGAFFEIRDGKIARVTNYYNLGDWIAQVGGDA